MKNKITVVLAVLVLSCMFAVAENLGYLDYTAGSTDITTTGDMECTDLTVNGDLDISGNVDVGGNFTVDDTLSVGLHINNDGTLQVDGRADFDGTVEFGNSAANDTVLLVSRIGSNLDPITNGGFSLGVSARRWDLFADDVNIADSFTVTGTADFGGNVSFGGTIATAADVIPDSSVNYGADLLTAVNGWWGDTSSNYATAADVGAKADTTVTNAILDSLGTMSPELDLYLEYSAAPDTLTASTIASGNAASWQGGVRNTISATSHYSTTFGTDHTVDNSQWGTIGGGTGHTVTAWYATIGGGSVNTASGNGSTVAGGYTNTASGKQSFVGGGYGNTASGEGSTVAGGISNIALAAYSTVAGGKNNQTAGAYSVIPGGAYNTASGYASFAFGQFATATDSFSAHFFAADDSFDTAYEGELVVGGAIRVEHDTLRTAVLVDSSGLTADVDTSFKQGFDWFKDNPEYYVQGGSSGSDTIRPSAYSVGDYILIYKYPFGSPEDSLVIFVDLDGSDSIFSVAYDTTVTLTDTIFTAYDGVSVFRTIYTSYLTADSITAANWIAAVRVDADTMAADYFIGGISEMDYFTGDSAAVGKLKVGTNGTTVVGEWKGSITWTNNTERFAISCPGMTTDGGAVWSLGGTTEADYTISLEIKADSIAFNAEPADTTAMAGKVFYYSAWNL